MDRDILKPTFLLSGMISQISLLPSKPIFLWTLPPRCIQTGQQDHAAKPCLVQSGSRHTRYEEPDAFVPLFVPIGVLYGAQKYAIMAVFFPYKLSARVPVIHALGWLRQLFSLVCPPFARLAS